MDWKIDDEEVSGRGVWADMWEQTYTVKYFCVTHNADEKACTMEEALKD